jgi:hypothetical protein
METVLAHRGVSVPAESPASGVSWGAVMGGAFVTAALWVALLALGAGFGLAIVSPWNDSGASAGTIGVAAIVWLVVSQVVASSLGGYLTGRLRTKWAAVHTDEVYFRDTANGFLAWAVALVIGAFALGSAATSLIGTSAADSGKETRSAAAADATDPNGYYLDRLFRTETIVAPPPVPPAEAERIFVKGLAQGEMPSDDKRHLGKIVASRTGLAQNDAEMRVDVVMAEARQAADAVRKVAAHVLLWTFLALLMGAFGASYAATIGGRQRDNLRAVA